MAEEEKFKLNKSETQKTPFCRVFHYNEEMINGNYSWDALKSPVEKNLVSHLMLGRGEGVSFLLFGNYGGE